MAEIVLGLAASHGSSTFAPSSTWDFYAARDRRKPYYDEMLANDGRGVLYRCRGRRTHPRRFEGFQP